MTRRACDDQRRRQRAKQDLLHGKSRVVRVRVEGSDLPERRPLVLVVLGRLLENVQVLAGEQNRRIVFVERHQGHVGRVPESDGSVLVTGQQQLSAFRLVASRLLAENDPAVYRPRFIRVQMLRLRFPSGDYAVPKFLGDVWNVLGAGDLGDRVTFV